MTTHVVEEDVAEEEISEKAQEFLENPQSTRTLVGEPSDIEWAASQVKEDKGDLFKSALESYQDFFDKVNALSNSREKSLAVTNLEVTGFWLNKAAGVSSASA